MAKSSNTTYHHYKDHSNDIVDEQSLYTLLGIDQAKEEGSNFRQDAFPVKLHYVLTEMERDGLSHIASWQPHGRCFVIHNRKEFVDTILPLWFRQSKFTSFQRQLNIYGFKRLTNEKGGDKGGYYHELFLRSKPTLSHLIQRTTVKGTKTRKTASPETEPNFYQMPYLPYTILPNETNDGLLLQSAMGVKSPTSCTDHPLSLVHIAPEGHLDEESFETSFDRKEDFRIVENNDKRGVGSWEANLFASESLRNYKFILTKMCVLDALCHLQNK